MPRKEIELKKAIKPTQQKDFDYLSMEDHAAYEEYDDYGRKVVNDSIVEQITIPDDSTEFGFQKHKKFKMINSTL